MSVADCRARRSTKRTTEWENLERKKRKISEKKYKRNFYVKQPIVLTSDLHTEEVLNTFQNTINPWWNKEESFPKERQGVSGPLSVSLFCQQESSPPTILWNAPIASPFTALCHQSKVDLPESGEDAGESLLMSLAPINSPSARLGQLADGWRSWFR